MILRARDPPRALARHWHSPLEPRDQSGGIPHTRADLRAPTGRHTHTHTRTPIRLCREQYLDAALRTCFQSRASAHARARACTWARTLTHRRTQGLARMLTRPHMHPKRVCVCVYVGLSTPRAWTTCRGHAHDVDPWAPGAQSCPHVERVWCNDTMCPWSLRQASAQPRREATSRLL